MYRIDPKLNFKCSFIFTYPVYKIHTLYILKPDFQKNVPKEGGWLLCQGVGGDTIKCNSLTF